MTITVRFTNENKPSTGEYEKLRTDRYYTFKITGHEFDEEKNRIIWAVSALVSNPDEEEQWRPLPQYTYSLSLSSEKAIKYYRQLTEAIGLTEKGNALDEEVSIEESDFYNMPFEAKLNYKNDFPNLIPWTVRALSQNGQEELELPM